MKLDVLKTTFANFQRPQNLQAHVFLKNVFHSESPCTGHTLKMIPSLECAAWAQQWCAKPQPCKRFVMNRSSLSWNANQKNACDTLSRGGNQHWGWGTDRQMLLGAAWAPFTALCLLCLENQNPRIWLWAELCRYGNHRSLAPGKGAVRWTSLTNVPVLLLEDLFVWSLLNDPNMHLRTNFPRTFLEN